MYKSVVDIYGSWFGGGDVGRHSVTSETMKDEATVDAILKIGFFWDMNRAGLEKWKNGNYRNCWPGMEDLAKFNTHNWGGHGSFAKCVEALKKVEEQYPAEACIPKWVEHKDHRRHIWGYGVGRRAQVLFNQGKLSEDELYAEQ